MSVVLLHGNPIGLNDLDDGEPQLAGGVFPKEHDYVPSVTVVVKKMSELIGTTTLADEDLFDTSQYVSPSSYRSRKVTFEVIKEFLLKAPLPYVSKTANYTLTEADYLVNCTANSFDITLPTAVGIEGKVYCVKNSGTGTITLKTTSSQTIDGNASGTITLAQWNSVSVISTGANWLIVE